MSACSPSMTARACLPDPPCDWLTVTAWPVLAFQAAVNAAFTSWYNSRVGSYDTFSSVTDASACSGTATGWTNCHTIAAAPRDRRTVRMTCFMRSLLVSDLNPREQVSLGFASTEGGAAPEVGFFEVGRQLDRAVEVPIDAGAPRA